MKRVKRIALALVCVMLVGALSGCGSKFDAPGYLNALLDASYKGDYKAFVDMKLGTEEEAADLYEQGIDAEMNAFLSGMSVSDELEGEFRDIFKQMLGSVKYTVGEAEKQDDDYVVTVTYQKMKIFEPVMTQYMDEITALTEEWTSNPDSMPTTEDEMMEAMLVILRDCMKEALPNVEYGESATTTVRIELIDNVYTPNQRDVTNLETIFFDTEAASSF
ncbi:MAG: hypothetical protein NC337_10360 [Roseburia sp.]|nr:hypothetical protein [Roseburia sp.]